MLKNTHTEIDNERSGISRAEPLSVLDMRRKTVSVIGNAAVEDGSLKYRMAFEMGKALVDAGYRVQSGGLGGVMEAAFRGARSSGKYREGDTIAIIPSFDSETANKYADIVIPTGLDLMRNALVANADAVVAVGGGAGTLCEMSLAWTMKRLILAFTNVDGWSSRLAGMCLDERIRYKDIPDDRVYGISSAEEGIIILNEMIDIYVSRHQGIASINQEEVR